MNHINREKKMLKFARRTILFGASLATLFASASIGLAENAKVRVAYLSYSRKIGQ
jgi:hypothetical protein